MIPVVYNLVVEALADDEAALRHTLAGLETENTILREMLSLAIGLAHEVTRQRDRARLQLREHAQLRREQAVAA